MTYFYKNQSGNAVIIVLAVLVVVAVGALAYLSGQMAGENISAPEVTQTAQAQTPAPAETAQNEAADAEAQDEAPTIVPGNPVVAKLNGEDITRQDIFVFMQTLPPQTRQLPPEQLFPLALEQVINAKIITDKTKDVNLDNDERVKEQLEAAKTQIVRGVFIENTVNERMTEDRLKQAYADYVEEFPKEEEVKAAHILVDEKEVADSLIEQLNNGREFAQLAQESSKDNTANNGGELGYFLKGDVVPEFAEAAFGLEPGTYTRSPVKSQFGYHIIRVDEKRIRPPADFETVKPFLEAQLRRGILDEVLQGWRDDSTIERFDINGKPIEPAAGTEEGPAESTENAPAQ